MKLACCLLAVASVLSACSREPEALPGREGRERYVDEAVTAALAPDLPIVEAFLWKDERRFVTYRSVLREPAPKGYADRYLERITSRGVVVKPIGTSPHAFPPRTWGYRTYFIRVSRPTPLTLSHTTFDSRDHQWLERHRFRSAPWPLTVAGAVLELTLGKPDSWEHEVVLPERDSVDVKELPVRRYPSAVLKRAWVPNETHVRDNTDVHRAYVVRGAGMAAIARHYASELRRLGVSGFQESPKNVFWRGTETGGIVGLSVHEAGLSMIQGSGFGLRDLRSIVPGLAAGVPADLIEFGISVDWPRPADRLEYLPRGGRPRGD